MTIDFISMAFIAAVIIIALLAMKSGKKRQNNNKENPQIEPKTENAKEDFDYSNSYQHRQFMSPKEQTSYNIIRDITDEIGLILFAKVRLFDLIEPKQGTKYKKGAQWKIQAKHVDFVICDRTLKVKAIIEIDDSSHDRKDRVERDKFVDEILKKCGYKVIHTRNVSKDELRNAL